MRIGGEEWQSRDASHLDNQRVDRGNSVALAPRLPVQRRRIAVRLVGGRRKPLELGEVEPGRVEITEPAEALQKFLDDHGRGGGRDAVGKAALENVRLARRGAGEIINQYACVDERSHGVDGPPASRPGCLPT